MFKRCKVVMFLTNEKATGIGMYKDTNRLVYNQKGKDIPRGEMQHLYILSDEEIKEGDWYITLTNDICKCGNKTNFTPKGKKIITSTDESLGLSKPSDSFIQKYVKKYNEGKPITDVLVEYEGFECKNGHYMAYQTSCVYPYCDEPNYPVIKVSSDNTITIKKVKDNWSRDEVINIIKLLEGVNIVYENPLTEQSNTLRYWEFENLNELIEENL